jgi:hypothetical protein
VTGTLRAIVTGLSYLATFLFGANAVGLTGLGLQTLLQGGAATQMAPGGEVAATDSEKEGVEEVVSRGDQVE